MIKYHGNKKDVCYVGDSLNDCLSAINAGVVPILLDRDDEYVDILTKVNNLSANVNTILKNTNTIIAQTS